MPGARDKIILDFERMKYPHTGLYHFCWELGKALQQNAAVADLYFFLSPVVGRLFGNDARYINQHFTHKLLLPDTSRYTVWHATHQGSMYYPFNRKIPVVLTVHDLNFMHTAGRSAASKKKYTKQLQKKIDRADHIVTISEFVREDLQQHVHLGNTPASVIYNGCNIHAINDPKAPGGKPKKDFLFSIGTITEKKNFHVLPALLVNNGLELVIAGVTHNEEYKKRIIEEARKHHVQERVHFTGAISEEDKQWYYQHCRAFVFPSLAEGFGMPVIEAMYFGKPVFLSLATSLPEVGGKYAYYFDELDPAAMQQALATGLLHYDQQNPADAIRAHALSFNWNAAAKAYLDIYRSLG